MSSRDQILSKVKANRPLGAALPDNIIFKAPLPENWLALFIKSFESAGGIAIQVTHLSLIGQYLEQHFKSPDTILNTVAGVNYGREDIADLGKGHVLENLDTAVIEGNLGVSENGAIWVTEDKLPIRVLPFICEHLVLVISESKLVGTMHEAYNQIKVTDNGYGVFIAGPSRTADIEQSLVIGAHGPKRAHVFILTNQ